MNQPLDPRNSVRRVAAIHLVFMGDLNRFKTKFLASAALAIQGDSSTQSLAR